MHKVEVPNARIDECFEWSQGHTLEDAGPQKTLVILAAGAGPDTAHDHQNMPEQKQMAFAPDTGRGYDQNARHTNTAQVVTGQQRCGLKCDFLIICYCDGVRSQDGAEGGTEDGDEGQNREDDVASPEWPVLV